MNDITQILNIYLPIELCNYIIYYHEGFIGSKTNIMFKNFLKKTLKNKKEINIIIPNKCFCKKIIYYIQSKNNISFINHKECLCYTDLLI